MCVIAHIVRFLRYCTFGRYAYIQLAIERSVIWVCMFYVND